MDFSSRTFNPGSGVRPKSQEKDAMVGLNDKFVRLIDTMKNQENEKKKLTKKLELLQGQDNYAANVDDIVRKLLNDLEQKIDNLVHDQRRLKDELERMQKVKEDSMTRYEDEMEKRAQVESDFVITKAELDKNHRDLVEDALELEKLNRKLAFLRDGFDEEIKELESMIKNEVVVLSENSKRSLDMDEIVKNAEVQYATMANRAREEAELWNKKKMDDLVLSAGQREQEVRDLKREISDLLRLIQRLKTDLEGLQRKAEALKEDIDDARKDGESTMDSVRGDIAALENALFNCKKELAKQVKNHQELLNIKLGLDIEIATYRRLLEGEEKRISQCLRTSNVHLPERKDQPERKYTSKKPQAAENTAVPMTSLTQDATVTPDTSIPLSPKKRLLIRLEVESGKVVSKSSQLTD